MVIRLMNKIYAFTKLENCIVITSLLRYTNYSVRNIDALLCYSIMCPTLPDFTDIL